MCIMTRKGEEEEEEQQQQQQIALYQCNNDKKWYITSTNCHRFDNQAITRTRKSPRLLYFDSCVWIMSFSLLDPIPQHTNNHLNPSPRIDEVRVMYGCTISLREVRFAQVDKVHPQRSRKHVLSSTQYKQMLNGRVMINSCSETKTRPC